MDGDFPFGDAGIRFWFYLFRLWWILSWSLFGLKLMLLVNNEVHSFLKIRWSFYHHGWQFKFGGFIYHKFLSFFVAHKGINELLTFTLRFLQDIQIGLNHPPIILDFNFPILLL